jgi:hypothetical protein
MLFTSIYVHRLAPEIFYCSRFWNIFVINVTDIKELRISSYGLPLLAQTRVPSPSFGFDECIIIIIIIIGQQQK